MFQNIIGDLSFDVIDGEFIYTYLNDKFDDKNNLINAELYKSNIFYNTYFYGYKLNYVIPPDLRSRFISEMKGLTSGINKVNEAVWHKFFVPPIKILGKELQNIDNIDCIVYPLSKRTNINKILVEYIGDYVLKNNFIKLGLYKRDNVNIKFDYAMFDRYEKENLGKTYHKWIEKINLLLERIQNSGEYFSIAACVKPLSLRRYFYDFLEFKNPVAKEVYNSLKEANVLLLDDINTTESTLRECLRVINSVITPRNITIFTMLGRDSDKLNEMTEKRQ